MMRATSHTEQDGKVLKARKPSRPFADEAKDAKQSVMDHALLLDRAQRLHVYLQVSKISVPGHLLERCIEPYAELARSF